MAAEQGLDLPSDYAGRSRSTVCLCRLFANAESPWLLKGGYAMELRIRSARTTRDIDLAAAQMPGAARSMG